MNFILELAKLDLYRYYARKDLKCMLKAILFNRNYRVIFLHRLCQYISLSKSPFKSFLLFPLKILHRFALGGAGIDLPIQTKISEGFCINHGWGVVINPNAIIGKNVTIFHGVTIGQRDKILDNSLRVSSYPVIEDGVWIGPNAIIVGGVKVGKGSIIAAGAFITESIPEYSVVIGNPSRIVKSNCLPDIVNEV